MIGVICKAQEALAVAEFFELFKTPWEPLEAANDYEVVLSSDDVVPETNARLVVVFNTAPMSIDAQLGLAGKTNTSPLGGGVRISTAEGIVPIYGKTLAFQRRDQGRICCNSDAGPIAVAVKQGNQIIIRVGFDLFDEVRYLLMQGQPVENASIPTLDVHIRLLRSWMIESGVNFIEIPPVPYGYEFTACLTHDIDFVGIKRHKFDHTIAGFLYRSVVTSFSDFVQGKISFVRLMKIWKAVVSVPFVHLGLAKDFWLPFEWYLEVEKELNPTYFLIPFKGVPGRKVNLKNAKRRASPYEPREIKKSIETLLKEGCEVGVHGIDAWHDVESGTAELKKIQSETCAPELGIRMHWLLRDEKTNQILEAAGYFYDSTFGYNETVGYRAGTAQVFRPLDVSRLLELPLHIQDGALFYRNRLALSEQAAMDLCNGFINNATQFGGVLTLLWHDRSHGPERFWGEFYRDLIERLKQMPVWFATAMNISLWFSRRRDIKFVRDGTRRVAVDLKYNGPSIAPPLTIRSYNSSGSSKSNCASRPWSGQDSPWRQTEIEPSTVIETAVA